MVVGRLSEAVRGYLLGGWKHVAPGGFFFCQGSEVGVVCDHQWNPLVVANPCPWSESIFSPDVRRSINLVLEKGGFVATMQEVGFQLKGPFLEIIIS